METVAAPPSASTGHPQLPDANDARGNPRAQLWGIERRATHGLPWHQESFEGFNVKFEWDAKVVLRDNLGLKTERGSRQLRTWSYLIMISTLFLPLQAIASERQLDSITVEAKKEREELRLQVDHFVTSAVVHHFGESLMRWDTRVCPLVAGLPRDQGEFILQRFSQSARNAGAPLAPEKCTANFFVLVSSQADRILEELRKKRPKLFNTTGGLGALQHFLVTERPIHVWYNWQNQGDPAAGTSIISAPIGSGPTVGGLVIGGVLTGPNSPSSVWSDRGSYRLPNTRLSLTVTKSINTAIIVVDLPRMKGVNLGQLADYVTMVGLAEINLDRTIVSAPSVLRLFSEPGEAPVDGMSPWDQALLKSLYATRAQSVMQISELETQMVDSITTAQH